MTNDVPSRLSLDHHEATDLLFAVKEGIRVSAGDGNARFERLIALYAKATLWLDADDAPARARVRRATAEPKPTRLVPRAIPAGEATAEEMADLVERDEAEDSPEEEPKEEPKPPPEPIMKVSLATALKWYCAREGRAVKAMGGGAFQIEARDDILNVRQLMSVINQTRRRADQPKFELKE